MRLMAIAFLGWLVPATAWAQAMVEVPNAPPPPPRPSVVQQHRAPSRYELFIDVTPGIAVPLGGQYASDFGPSFTMDGHVGLAIWMRGRRLALAPELSVGGTVLNTTTFGGYEHGLTRVRGEAALRVLVPIGHHLVVYPRVGLGGDYLSGSVFFANTTPGPGDGTAATASASSFLFEAGGGMIAMLGRHFAVGAYVGVPIAPMKVEETTMAGIEHLGTERFTAVELTATAVLTLRL